MDLVNQFNDLVPDLYTDDEKQMLFFEMLRSDWNVRLLAKDEATVARMKQGADERDKWMTYAYARYHDAVRPDAQSLSIAAEHYHRAAYNEVPDALMYLAYMRLYGEYGDRGQVDRELYAQFRDTAAKKGSYKAILARITDMTYGQYGFKHEPLEAYKLQEQFVTECEEHQLRIDPYHYTLLGRICEELGRILEADMWYNKAIEHGDLRAYYQLALIRACGKKGEIADQQELMDILQKGMDAQAPDAFLAEALCMDKKAYAKLSPEQKTAMTQTLREHLEKAYELGEPFGAAFLADCYLHGRYGFKRDKKAGKLWAERGAQLCNGLCYAMLAGLAEDETAKYEYYLKAVRYGETNYMVSVVEGYRKGLLDDFQTEIEKYYLPIVEEEELMDEYEEEDGRYDAWA